MISLYHQQGLGQAPAPAEAWKGLLPVAALGALVWWFLRAPETPTSPKRRRELGLYDR